MANTVCSVGKDEERWIWSMRNEFEWVDDVSQVGCTCCSQVMIFHYTSSCGHKFCPDCKEYFESRVSEFVCSHPGCWESVFYMTYKWDPNFDQKISELRARCPNRLYGCTVVEKLSLLIEHMEGCKINQNKALMAVMTQLARLTVKMDKIRTDVLETDRKVYAFGTEVASDLNDIQAEVTKMNTEIGALSEECKEKDALAESNQRIGGRISALMGKLRCIGGEEETDVRLASQEHGAEVMGTSNTLTKLTNIGQEIINLEFQ